MSYLSIQKRCGWEISLAGSQIALDLCCLANSSWCNILFISDFISLICSNSAGSFIRVSSSNTRCFSLREALVLPKATFSHFTNANLVFLILWNKQNIGLPTTTVCRQAPSIMSTLLVGSPFLLKPPRSILFPISNIASMNCQHDRDVV